MTHIIKKPMLMAAFVATMLFAASCKDTRQQGEDTKEVSEDQNEAKFNDNDNINDAQFLVDASEMNLEAIELSILAQQRGTSSNIKELGNSIVETHKTSQGELSSLAKVKTICIPTYLTNDNKEIYNKLNRNTGQDFDKAYIDLMVDMHKKAIELFEMASSNSNDTQIQNWATSSLLNTRKQLDEIIISQKKIEMNN